MALKKLNLNLTDIHSWLKYNKKTGQLIWIKVSSSCTKIGDIAGSVNVNGYRAIGFGGKYYKAHRLIYFMNNNKWPKFIDHINGNRSDNRLCNLREVSKETENQQNRKCHRNGILWGTSYHPKTKTYNSRVRLNNEIYSLGYYKTRKQAHNVSVKFAKDNHIKLLREK